MSSLAMTSAMARPDAVKASSSVSKDCRATSRLLRTASGAFSLICGGELERDVDRLARLGHAVDEAERVGPLGVDRVAR